MLMTSNVGCALCTCHECTALWQPKTTLRYTLSVCILEDSEKRSIKGLSEEEYVCIQGMFNKDAHHAVRKRHDDIKKVHVDLGL